MWNLGVLCSRLLKVVAGSSIMSSIKEFDGRRGGDIRWQVCLNPAVLLAD